MDKRKRGEKRPEGKTKLNIIQYLLNRGECKSKEIRNHLKKNYNIEDLSTHKRHEKGLLRMGILEKKQTDPGLSNVYKLKENFEGFKAIFNFISEYGESGKYRWEKDILDLLLSDYAEKTINEEFFKKLSYNFVNHIILEGSENKEFIKNLSIDVVTFQRLFFPPSRHEELINIVRYSPSCVDFLINPDKIESDLFDFFLFSTTSCMEVGSIMDTINTNNPEVVEDMLNDIRKSRNDKTNFDENLDNSFPIFPKNLDQFPTIKLPIRVFLESLLIRDLLESNLPKKELVEDQLIDIFIPNDKLREKIKKEYEDISWVL